MRTGGRRSSNSLITARHQPHNVAGISVLHVEPSMVLENWALDTKPSDNGNVIDLFNSLVAASIPGMARSESGGSELIAALCRPTFRIQHPSPRSPIN